MYITVFTPVIFRRYLFNLLLKDIELTFSKFQSHIFKNVSGLWSWAEHLPWLHLSKGKSWSNFEFWLYRNTKILEYGTAVLKSNICLSLFNQENVKLKLFPKLQRDHIFVTTYSRINDRLALQMLSKNVANILTNCYPFETDKTAEFSEMINNLFYIFSVSESVEGFKAENSFLKLFTSNFDERFS